MAISWLTVLQAVPWSEVISNAPKVAESAKKLWAAVARKGDPVPSPVPPGATPIPEEPPDSAVAELQHKLVALESAVADLHAQMLASSQLVKELAEQNTQLIARIELNRRRTAWLVVAVALSAAVSIAFGLALVLPRGA